MCVDLVCQSLGQQHRGFGVRMAHPHPELAMSRSSHPSVFSHHLWAAEQGVTSGDRVAPAEADPDGADSGTPSDDHNPPSWAASPVWRGVWVVPVFVHHPSRALAQDGYQLRSVKLILHLTVFGE